MSREKLMYNYVICNIFAQKHIRLNLHGWKYASQTIDKLTLGWLF